MAFPLTMPVKLPLPLNFSRLIDKKHAVSFNFSAFFFPCLFFISSFHIFFLTILAFNKNSTVDKIRILTHMEGKKNLNFKNMNSSLT